MPQISFVDLGLPELPLVSKGEVEPDLRYLYFAVQNLAYAVGQKLGLDEPVTGAQSDPAYTIGPSKRRLFVIASEAIAYGELVNLWDDAGDPRVQLADATDDTKPCHGICNTVSGVGVGETAEIVLANAYVNSVSGLTFGVTYYLAAGTPGGGTNVPPAASGNIIQAIGFAVAADGFFFNPSSLWITVP